MAATKRTPEQREADLVIVADMYKRGKSLREIAAVIGVSFQQIGFDLKRLRKEWRESGIYDLNFIQSQQLDKIDKIESEAWEAWKRSCQPKEVTTTGKRGDISEAHIRREGQAGDPRFLERVGWCVEQRCKIFGFYAPTKINISELDSTIEAEILKHAGVIDSSDGDSNTTPETIN